MSKPAMSGATQKPATEALVLEELDGAVQTLRLNRPERLNALNVELGRALVDALGRAASDGSTRVIVLTGAGRGFCAGGDLAVLRDARSRNAGHELEGLLRAGKEIAMAIRTMPKPVIAAVNGPAAGAGMNLALACDLRIASDQATFGETFARVGLFPDFGGTYFLPKIVGAAKAAELFYTAEMISAAEAERLGIVNRVVPEAKFAEEAKKFAARLAAGPPMAIRAIKKVLFAAECEELERVLDAEIERQVECFLSADCAEGLDAFFAKREPRFHGN
ncbi:MAG TPA: enoyl-CoA hydratase [Candidatus Acidoferrales bacterium]|nr:enoyl-CoA hydratase [Candidatus Acidoferrales bacterium]